MIKCGVPSCRNIESDQNYQFFKFPKTNLKSVWLQNCFLPQNLDSDYLKICEKHFAASDFEASMHHPAVKKLFPVAVPSLDLDGPPVDIQTLGNFKGHIIEEMHRNANLMKRQEALLAEINALSEQPSTLDQRITTKTKEIKYINNKFRLLRKKVESKEKNLLLSKVFSDSQINYLIGKPKVIWSDDDMAMAFTLRQMSNKECYLYLKYTLNIPLPSLSSVQKWAASK